ncbi:hypothetical protein [Telmatospirillum sp.]|uniref:hypothetical protein n=1 Tax=Telmatospirillum sp. TaxID=2079197 RepID=UPI0028494973|nr:hypothetical protein [Telmatospirillum sp.]MDR3436164.1 hypothetical protein [Telmatospirillum sp.]
MLLLALPFLVCHAMASDDAPFGLRWGAGIEELKVRGLSGEVVEDDGNHKTFVARTLPKPTADTGATRLTIHHRYGLQRIAWQSKDLSDDPTGEKGLDAYSAMKSSLTAQFGRPKSSDEEMPATPDRNRLSFYQCLAQDGCGAVVSVWSTPEGDVRARLTGTTAGIGRLEVIFLGPDWSDVAEDLKKPNRK